MIIAKRRLTKRRLAFPAVLRLYHVRKKLALFIIHCIVGTMLGALQILSI